MEKSFAIFSILFDRDSSKWTYVWLAYVEVLNSEFIMQCISSVLGLFLGIENLAFVFLGLGIYIWKEDKRKFQIWYIVFCVLFSLFGFLQIIPRINLRTDDVYFSILATIANDLGLTVFYTHIDISYFFLENFQWLMIFALPLMSLFYRKKDKYQKHRKSDGNIFSICTIRYIYIYLVLSERFLYNKRNKKGGVEKREKAYTNMARNQQVNTKGENSHNEERKTNFIIDSDSLNAYRVSDF